MPCELRSGTAPPFLPITVDQFQQMIEQGILKEGDPVELIDGVMVRKDRSISDESFMGHHPRHALLILRLQRLLRGICESAGWHLRIQLPVRLNDNNAPEPDIAVARGSEEEYADRHPGPEDLVLVIEVAGSSLGTDRTTKQRLYATAGIPRYWIANLTLSQMEFLEQPDSATNQYADQSICTGDQPVSRSLSTALRVEINAADLFQQRLE